VTLGTQEGRQPRAVADLLPVVPVAVVAGGGMAAVIEETSKLPAEDREAIAAYLKAVPAVD